MSQKFDLKEFIDNLPMGLDRAILKILSRHVGRDNAISRGDLLRTLAQTGFRVHDRVMRAQINQLRKSGQIICSTGGVSGGYFLASCWEELLEYVDGEVHSRAMDLLEQESALKAAAEKRWGRYSPEKQATLF